MAPDVGMPAHLTEVIDDLTVPTSMTVAYELAGELVLVDGTVLPFDLDKTEASCADEPEAIDCIRTRFETDPPQLRIELDPTTGAITGLHCFVPII